MLKRHSTGSNLALCFLRLGWRWAFLCQVPLFLLSLMLTTINLRYVTKGKGKSTIEVLKRIDYFGSLTLLISVCSFFVYLFPNQRMV